MRKWVIFTSVFVFFTIPIGFGSFIHIDKAYALANKLLVVRGQNNNLYKSICTGNSCTSWEQFPGQFTQQPTLVWDDDVKAYYVYGVGEDGRIWRGTFDEDGNFQNDWTPMPGSTPSPIAAAKGPAYKVINIGTNDFEPVIDGYNWLFYDLGGALRPMDELSPHWCAPLSLPANATIKSITFYYYNYAEVAETSSCALYRSKNDDIEAEELDAMVAEDATGFGSVYHDNLGIKLDSQYYYFIYAHLPSADNTLVHVKVVYSE